jgi:hypothetical protein
MGVAVNDDDLAAGLSGLSGLLTGQPPSRATLIHIAELLCRRFLGQSARA